MLHLGVLVPSSAFTRRCAERFTLERRRDIQKFEPLPPGAGARAPRLQATQPKKESPKDKKATQPASPTAGTSGTSHGDRLCSRQAIPARKTHQTATTATAHGGARSPVNANGNTPMTMCKPSPPHRAVGRPQRITARRGSPNGQLWTLRARPETPRTLSAGRGHDGCRGARPGQPVGRPYEGARGQAPCRRPSGSNAPHGDPRTR